jgi:hypothetical protein
LSLLVIPVVYSYVDDGVQLAIRRFRNEHQSRQQAS